MIKVIIADDHPLIRKGIKQLLSETPNISVTAETENWQELIDFITKKHFDLVLLDINMPERNGLDVLKDIRKIKPELPVMILSIHEEEEYVLKAIQRGANGYISKTSEPEILIKAIEKVANGGQYISEHLADKLIFKNKINTYELPHTSLSKRELEIVKKISEGNTPRAIALELSISVKTVNAHREHILQKLNISSNAELIKYAIKHNL